MRMDQVAVKSMFVHLASVEQIVYHIVQGIVVERTFYFSSENNLSFLHTIFRSLDPCADNEKNNLAMIVTDSKHTKQINASEIFFIYFCRQSSSSQRTSSGSSGYENDFDSYVGIGVVGNSNDARFSEDDQNDVQSVLKPSFSNSVARQSSSHAYEAEDMQQRQLPVDLASVSSSAYRSSASERDESDLQRTVGHGYQPPVGHGGSASRIYAQNRDGSTLETIRPATVPVYIGGGSQTSSHRSTSSQSETEINESRKPGPYVSVSARPASVIAIPVRVIHTQGVPEEHQKYYVRTSEQSLGAESSDSRNQYPTSTTYRLTYTPSRNFVSSDKISSSNLENSRVSGSVQKPEKLTNYNTFGALDSVSQSSQSRFRAEESDSRVEQTQSRVVPATVSYPYNGGSSRFASSGSSSLQKGQVQARVDPEFSVNTLDSSMRTSEERDQRRFSASNPTLGTASRTSELDSRNQISTANRPTYVVSGRTSGSEQQQSSSNQGSSGSIYYVPISSNSRLQSGSGSQSQYQQRQGTHFSPYLPNRHLLTNSQFGAPDRLSQRFGTNAVNIGSNDDLQTFMSESERLARLQKHQISGSSSNVAVTNSEANRRTFETAANLDSTAANFVRSSNLANRNSEFDTASADGAEVGGYNRVRSWNTQSKWSSGKLHTS